MGSGCTKTEAGDVQQPRTADAVDGEQANGTHSADSKKGLLQQFIHLVLLFVSKLSSLRHGDKKC